MSSPIPSPYLLASALAAVYLVAQIPRLLLVRYKLRGIPSVEGSSIITSHLVAWKFIWNCREILQKGYEEHYGSAFKFPEFNRWHVVVCGDDMVDDMRRANDDQLSFDKAFEETMQMKYLFGPVITGHDYSHNVIRGPLTRNVASQFPEVKDEIVTAFSDEIPPRAEWKSVWVMGTIWRIISRTTNRLFVGLPLCRDPAYRDLNIDFTIDVVLACRFFSVIPAFARPFIALFFRNIPRKVKQATELLGPIIQDRIGKDERLGPKWEGRPNDLISWLLDEAPPHLKRIDDLVLRVLGANMAAIHTTAMTFSNALYHLAAYPEYVKPLREEIEAVIAEEGWNKISLGKMQRLDSFIKEAQRITGVSGLAMNRKVLKDFTFSNGLTVPAGTIVSAAGYATHTDETKYPNAHKFQGFRFADIRESAESEALKHHMVTPRNDYLLFGHGRHACPGRFFAVNELKLMLSHIFLTYDVKLPNDSHTPPASRWIGQAILPDARAEVLFRARA